MGEFTPWVVSGSRLLVKLSGVSEFILSAPVSRFRDAEKRFPSSQRLIRVPRCAALLFRTRPVFFHFPNFTLQSRWTGRTPAPSLLFFRDAPVSGVNFSLLQQFDQAEDREGSVLVL